MQRGKIIVIEGTDCSFKETQSKRLRKNLRRAGIQTATMSFPRYKTPTGRIVGDCYLGKNCDSWFGDANALDPRIASLYYAADRLAAVPEINAILDSGTHLILDRYVESNMGHQGGKEQDPESRQELFDFVHCLEYDLLEIPKPSAIVFLYMPYEVGMEIKKNRAGKADGHESSPEHLRNAEQAYLELAEQFNWLRIDCTPEKTLEGVRKRGDIAKEIFKKVFPILTT